MEVQDEEAMKRYVITLGNACLYYPRRVENRTTEQLLHMLSQSQDGKIFQLKTSRGQKRKKNTFLNNHVGI